MLEAVLPPEPLPQTIRSPAKARALLAPLFAVAESEKVAVLHLSNERRVLAVSVYPGSTDAADVPVRDIFAEALRLGSTLLVVAHNHPSGEREPSEADIRTSRLLAETGRSLGIRLVDHLIFAGTEMTSLRELGLL
ncbi:MAG TPA: JAB domain-containing protein [Allosphingosinicella sp.]|jgi:DNA repair protein RadC